MSDIFDNEPEFNRVLAIEENYSDFDFSMRQNPNYKDILPLKGTNAIKRSIRNLITISKYDRIFNTKLGAGIDDFLMEKNNAFTNAVIIEEIKRTLVSHEPRVRNVEVEIRSNYNAIQISIYFTVININREEKVDLVLYRNK